MSLFGNETYPIAQNSQLDQIPGAIVYDGSPGYVSGYDLHKSNTINTSQIGSSAIYTYTIHPDAAGIYWMILAMLITQKRYSGEI